MTRLVKTSLVYAPDQESWYLTTKKRWAVSSERTVYWGANQRPLRLRLHQKPPHSYLKPVHFNTYIQFGAHQKPVLGPLIGILTAQGGQGPFSGSKPNFIDLSRTGRTKGGIVFVFTPENIDWAKEEVKGYLYHPEQKRWLSCLFPLPNVVYNRIPLRSMESKIGVSHCLALLRRHPRIHLFNPSFFDKGELYQVLQRCAPLAHYLPYTKPLNSQQDLAEVLKVYGQAYLKPTQGKAGKGIFKALYEPDSGRYILYFHQGAKTKRLKTRSLSKFWSRFQQLKMASPYLVQQAVHLLQLDGAPFDLRTLLQKNHQGRWEVTGLGVRLAGANRITTHVPQGGRIGAPEDVLRRIFTAKETEQILSQVKQLAHRTGTELERHYQHLGEMSLDIGVDTQGRLWLFEANAKPMKFDEPHIRRKSLENIIGYAQYLTFKRGLKGAREHEAAHA